MVLVFARQAFSEAVAQQKQLKHRETADSWEYMNIVNGNSLCIYLSRREEERSNSSEAALLFEQTRKLFTTLLLPPFDFFLDSSLLLSRPTSITNRVSFLCFFLRRRIAFFRNSPMIFI